jgi:DNA-binding beta-propeller fold protein YncE
LAKEGHVEMGWHPRGRWFALVATACVLASWGGEAAASGAHGHPPSKPARVISGPAGLVAGTGPQPNGMLWLLAGSAASKNLRSVALNGSAAAKTPLPVSGGAQDVVESSSGLLALGLANADTGALQLLNAANGSVVSTVALPGPAQAVAAGSDGSTFYVLDGTPSARTVTVVSSLTAGITSEIPVPGDTVSAEPDPTQPRLFALGADGSVKVFSTPGGRLLSSFPVGKGARRLAISNDGTTLYVLKQVGASDDIGIVNVATQRQTTAIPAPSDTVDIQVSLDGSQIYDMVGTQRYGNIQLFATGR